MNDTRRKFRAAVGLIAASAALAGCSLRYDFTECTTTADCIQVESPGVYYTCEDNQCLPDPTVSCRTSSDCGTGQHCVDDACVTPTADAGTEPTDQGGGNNAPDMGEVDSDNDGVVDSEDNCPDVANAPQTDIDEDGIGDVCDPEVPTPCDDNTECTGASDLCVGGFCAELTSEECPQVIGNTTAANTFTFGVILPISAPYENIGPPLAKSVELAINEVNRGGGLPGGRRVAAVICDDIGNTARAQVAARHLVDNVGVPAIIGPIFSTPYVDVVTNVTKPAGVMTVSPTATDPNITFLDDDDLAFRMLPSDVFQARAIAKRVEQLGATSVTIFIKDDAYGNGLFNALNTELTFLPNNSRTAVKYADPATFGFDAAQITTEFQSKIGSALAARPTPDLALFIGTTETVNLALGFAKTILAQNGTPPQLIVTHGGIPDMPNISADTTPAGPSTVGEILDPLTSAVGPNIFNGTAFEQYNARFAAEFPGEPILTISTLTYDATATLLFSAAATAADTPITGRAMADAVLPRLVDKVDGTVVSAADGSFLSRGIDIIKDGGSIDYEGASHAVDYDANGDVLTDFLVFDNFQNPQSMTWEVVPNQLFPLAINTWLSLCAYAWNPPCGAGLGCSIAAPFAGACLPTCDLQDPMCTVSPFLMCQDQLGSGICNVP